jgi:hypothetical protein
MGRMNIASSLSEKSYMRIHLTSNTVTLILNYAFVVFKDKILKAFIGSIKHGLYG